MTATIHVGDALAVLRTLPADSVHCCVSSPPYWGLRDYGVDGQIGLEETPQQFVEALVAVYAEVRRVLRPDGVCWMNLGDSYTANAGGAQGSTGQRAGRRHTQELAKSRRGDGLKPKDLVGMPWRVAFALQEAGWWLRSDCIWSKPNPMPESITDRPTKAHEYVFLLTKSASYFYDADAVREDGTGRECDNTAPVKGYEHDPVKMRTRAGLHEVEATGTRNLRTVWNIATQPFAGAHFATFPQALAERCILAGTSDHGCCGKCGAPWRRVGKRLGCLAVVLDVRVTAASGLLLAQWITLLDEAQARRTQAKSRRESWPACASGAPPRGCRHASAVVDPERTKRPTRRCRAPC